jgi:transglutaminase-like putative cysteine protease
MNRFYRIRHLTQFRYDTPVSESLMELRMHPRTEGRQRCLSFEIKVDPRAQVSAYRDYLGNSIHHFDVPGKHVQLRIVTESLVEIQDGAHIPPAPGPDGWRELDALAAAGDYWEMLMPSHFAQPTEALRELAATLRVERRGDPLSFLCELNAAVHDWFDYAPRATRVDSPIDHAIEERKGVCQDFAHIMIALAREVKIPCRYVSGYLCPRPDKSDRSIEGASHAWVEALLPRSGWTGFDPTNNLRTGDRHIRTAVGRDYADVPPTRGIFKGNAKSELSVMVHVALSDAPVPGQEPGGAPEWQDVQEADPVDVQQQQQQQQ